MKSATIVLWKVYGFKGEEGTVWVSNTTSFAIFQRGLHGTFLGWRVGDVGFEAAWDSAASTIAVSPFSVLSFAPSLNLSSKVKSYEIHDTFDCPCLLIAQSSLILMHSPGPT